MCFAPVWNTLELRCQYLAIYLFIIEKLAEFERIIFVVFLLENASQGRHGYEYSN